MTLATTAAASSTMTSGPDSGTASSAAPVDASYLSSLREAARGQLVLKSRRPLPAFTCPIPVPPSSASVQQLRSAVVAVLTGQLSARASSSSTSNGSSSSSGSKAMSYSEHLKEQTIREWRMSSIVLELRQNEIIAPETRNDPQADEAVTGFELLDTHDCALLEHGDEIFIKVKQGHSVESLRLPQLPSSHRYGLPDSVSSGGASSRKKQDSDMLAANQASTGLLTAQGRMAARSHDADPYNFVPPTNPLLEPAEPSSHSSSVSAHPQVQYMTKLRHQAPAGARVIGLADISHGVSRATQPLAAAAAAATASSPPNSPPPLYEKLADRERRPSLNNSRRLHSYQAIGSSGTNGLLSMQPVIAPPAESQVQASATKQQQQQSARPTQHRSVSAPNESSPPPAPLAALSSPTAAAAAAAPAAATPAAPASSEQRAPPRAKAVRQASSSSKADKQEWERQRKAGQRGMPSDALVIGPGVQGRIGPARMASYDSKVSNSDESASTNGNGYGNLEAFVSFTKAGGEVQARPTADTKNTRSASYGKGSTAGAKPTRPKTNGRASHEGLADGGKEQAAKPAPRLTVELPTKPVLPPIRNLSPFDAAPTDANTEGQQQQQEGTATLEVEKPFPLILASTPHSRTPAEPATAESASAGRRSSSAKSTPGGVGGFATLEPDSTPRSINDGRGDELSPQPQPLTDQLPVQQAKLSESEAAKATAINQGSGRSKKSDGSRAERRFAEVQKALQAEKDRQDQEDAKRLAKIKKREEDRAKDVERRTTEAREKREKAKWSVWQEVRKREGQLAPSSPQ